MSESDRRLNAILAQLYHALQNHRDLVKVSEARARQAWALSPATWGEIVSGGVDDEALAASDNHVARLIRELIVEVNTPYSIEAIQRRRRYEQEDARRRLLSLQNMDLLRNPTTPTPSDESEER